MIMPFYDRLESSGVQPCRHSPHVTTGTFNASTISLISSFLDILITTTKGKVKI